MAQIQTLQNRLSTGTAYPPVAPNWGAEFTQTSRTDTYAYIDPTTRSNCAGKAVLITGGNKGIGLGVAISYAKAGASHIAITSRSEAGITSSVIEAIRTAAAGAARDAVPEVVGLVMDVTDSQAVQRAAADIEARFGRLDVLVCNAGFLARYEKILDGDEDEWWKSFEVNLRGQYLVTKAFLPLMLTKGGDKTIVTMSSTGAMHFLQGGSSYQISKFALLRHTEFLMAEYGDQGLLAYSMHPGGVATDLSSRLPQATQPWLKCTPALGGDTLAFLTSERQEWLAGRYITAMWDMEEFFAKKQEIIDRDLLKMRLTF
ncbi:putative NADP-binding protein [Rosellinia necatrix]|uniref:Putative NADP-binding protein n=1 Tax=Rosellinia necatrix TaxID=77044 RepID=A0A1W2TIS6_ROSNE|nr:putative NADP-binding protein [Rosellinia necatrix]